MHSSFTFISIVALATSALAGPTGQRTTCASHCVPSETFGYEVGKSYLYKYDVETSTALVGTSEDEAKMHITANARIDVDSPCEYILYLSDVVIEGSSQSAEFNDALTKNPLRFSFQDGVIENLCSEESEPAWVLNFKRGVLSTFQNSVNYQDHKQVYEEIDILGKCSTSFEVQESGSKMSVIKYKFPYMCTMKPNLASRLSTMGGKTPTDVLPIFYGTSNCQHDIENNIMQAAKCEDIYEFRPFSSGKGGAVTKINNKLQFVSEQQATKMVTGQKFSIKSLVFDEESSTMTEGDVTQVENLLSKLSIATVDGIDSDVPVLFSKLVTALKGITYPELSNIYNNVAEPKLKKFLIDAMPLVGTVNSAGLVRDIMMNGEYSELEMDVWFTSLAFNKNPSSEMFTVLAPLMEQDPSMKAILGTSALINNYCKLHPNCESEPGIIQIIRAFETHLGSGCRAINEEQKTEILVTLKALGNAGRFVNAKSILRQCYADDKNDIEIRVAAIEAWRHTPCEYDKSNIQAMFQDETQDSEVRIAAYLNLMTCPTQDIIDTIKGRLTSEGVNQVGSFVWTHLTNLQESADPDKEWVRELIGEELLQNKFSTEALRYSRNYETSFISQGFSETGATIESNVIFSTKSFLPRSAMLNLTLDLFGESINFFEVGGRIEGFEAYIEKFFGPDGYFPEETVEGILRNMREQKTDYEETTLEGIIDTATDDPKGSYYLRVFGNELYYHHFRGLENIIGTSDASNPLEFLMELARKGDVDYSKTYQLFDTHYTIPTISGLPLSLTAKGIATIGLQMNGNFKAHSLKNINIDGHIHPSAAVEIDGLMVLDAHVTHTGLKIASNLHTSSFLDGKIVINKGKLVDVEFNTPKDKVEVINVQTKFFYVENDEEKEMVVPTQVEYEGCTSGMTGIALCGQYMYTPSTENSPLFPLVGPFGTHIYFKKTDTQTGYALKFRQTREDISFMFDTPGSQNHHKIFMDIAKGNKAFTLDVITPIKSVKGSGEYVWYKKNKNVKMALTIDGEQYTMDASFMKSNELNKYEPSLVLTSPNGEVLNLRGILHNDNRLIKTGLKVNSPILETTVDSELSYENALISLNTDIKYTLKGSTTHTIHQSAFIKKEGSFSDGFWAVNFELTPSEFPEHSMILDYKTVISMPKKIENSLKIGYGSVVWEYADHLKYTNENSLTIFETKASLKCPLHNLDYLLSEKLSFNRNNLRGELIMQGVTQKDMIYTLSLIRNQDIEISGILAAEIGEDKWSIEILYNKLGNGQYKLQQILKSDDSVMNTEVLLKSASTKDQIQFGISGKIETNVFPDSPYELELMFHGNKDKVAFALEANAGGAKKMTGKMEATKSSIEIDYNMIDVQHIYINSYVSSVNDVNKLHINAEWDKDVDPTKTFLVDGQISAQSVLLNFKFYETEYLFKSQLLNDGAEFEAKWPANQRIMGKVQYILGNTVSLSAMVETPFLGWEKQDAKFTLSMKDYELDSLFTVNWKNSEQITFNTKASVQPGMFSNAMKAEMLFTSTFEEFDHISFILDHTMVDTKINSMIEGVWDDKKLRGTFDFIPNEHGFSSSLNFISPFTNELLITLSHDLTDKSLASNLEGIYGGETTTATLKGHIDLTNVHDITVNFKVETPMEIIPKMHANLNYLNDGSDLKLHLDGDVNEQKLLLDVDGKLKLGQTTALTGNINFVTPLTYPLKATLEHTHDAHSFTTHYEMSRIWSSYGTIKVYANGVMTSKKDISLKVDLSSPVNKASMSFIHKLTGETLSSSLNGSLNGEKIEMRINGIHNTSLTNLDMNIISTVNELDDIKVDLKMETSNGGKTSTQKAIFTKGNKSVVIDHILTFNDALNWENTFKVNDNYALINKQTNIDGTYGHELEYIWNSEKVHLILNGDRTKTGDYSVFTVQGSLATPWTQDIKIDSQLKYNLDEYQPKISFEYGMMKMECDSVIKFDDAFFYIESNLKTNFWNPLGFRLNLDFKPRPGVTLVLIRGTNKTTIDIVGNWEPGKLEGSMDIQTTYLPLPLSLELTYDIISPEKTGHLVVIYDKKYEFKGLILGTLKNAKWSLLTELPFEVVKHMEFSGDYSVTSMPFSMQTMFKLNSQTYSINGHLSQNDFELNADFNGVKGTMSSNWLLSHVKSNIEVKLETSLSGIESFSVFAMYDISKKLVNIKLTRGTDLIDLTGKMENETIKLTGKTTFPGWENLQASFFASESAISAFVSRNTRKIEVSGAMHVKPSKGAIDLKILTPYTNYEEISSNLEYSLQGAVKKIEYISTFGAQQITVKGNIDVRDGLAPEMKLDITTPFDIVTRLGAMAKWNFKEATKSVTVKAYRNDREYLWEINATGNNSLKGQVSTKITTPFQGWTSLIIEANVDFASMPYKFDFTYNKEGDMKKIEGMFSFAQNKISAEFTTPISNWEKISVKGDYTMENDHFTVNTEINKNSEKYYINGDFLLNNRTPKVKVSLKTPLSYANNVEFILDSDMIVENKKFLTSLKIDDSTYSLDITGKKVYSKFGIVKILVVSPIPGYTNMEFSGKMDFTGDIKVIELDFLRENLNKHFSLATTVNDNKVYIEIQTPFEDYELMKFNGDYTTENDDLSLTTSFLKNGEQFTLDMTLSPTSNSAIFRMTTPIPSMQNVRLTGKYTLLDEKMEGELHFIRNSDVFDFNTKIAFSPLKSNLILSVNTPIPEWNTMVLNAMYDVHSNKKMAYLLLQKDSFVKKFSFEGSYTMNSGSFKIGTPVDGFNMIGAEYNLALNEKINKLDANLKIYLESNDWTFAAHGEYDYNKVLITFQTPFEGFNSITIQGNIDFDQKIGKGVIEFGPYKFTADVSYVKDNLLFELNTPFDFLKTFAIGAKYTWTQDNKNAMINMEYNDKKFVVQSTLLLQAKSSEIHLELMTPFQNFENIAFKAKYDIENRNELVCLELKTGTDYYCFKLGGLVEEKIALLTWELKSPFSGWTNVKFTARLDLTSDDKSLEIIMEEDGDIKMINISGKFIGDFIGLDLKTPFNGLENFNMYGSLNRQKRSLEFQMMADQGHASLFTSFDSLKLDVKTPFELTKHITWEFTKVDDHTFKAEVRRNANYATLDIKQQGKKKAFDIEINSEVQGWEFLALTGHLDQDTMEAYLSGQINEAKSSITGSGHFEAKGKFNVHIETPYEHYHSVEANLVYQLRRKLFKFEISSENSEFHFLLERDRSGYVNLQAHIPTIAEPTLVDMHLGIYNGKATVTSRWPALKEYYQEYNANVGPVTKADHVIKLNGLEIFKMELENDVRNKKTDLEIHLRRPQHETTIELHRNGFSSANFLFERDGKKFSIDTRGSGNLPTQGELDITIENTFRENPRTIKLHVTLNLPSSGEKHVKVDLTTANGFLYSFDLHFNAGIRNLKKGNFRLNIITPTRDRKPWKNVSGSWDLENPNTSKVTLNMGGMEYTAEGKLTLTESNLVLTPSNPSAEVIFLQWTFKRMGNNRDYLLKLGKQSNYALLKFKGSITDYAHVDIDAGFKAGPFMAHEFLFHTKWNKQPNSVVDAEGSFEYGPYHGENTLVFKRNPTNRSATFEAQGTSNVNNYNNVKLKGSYDFNHKAVFHVEVDADGRKSKIDINFSDINPLHSQNTINVNIPILGEYGQVELTVQHDFRQNTDKSFSAIARFANREAYIKAHWSRNNNFDVINGNIDVKSKLFGEIHIKADIDFSNSNDAHATVTYERQVRGQTRNASIKWTHKKTPTHLESEFVIDTPYPKLNHVRFFANADYSNLFNLRSGIDYNDKHLTFTFDIKKKSVEGHITTPFRNFEVIDGKIKYNLGGKKKSVQLEYTRGNSKINLDFQLNMTSKKEGNFKLDLTSPFEVVRNLHIEGDWANGQGNVKYQRNQVNMNFSGNAEVKADKSSFDISFTPPSGNRLHISAAYDVAQFLQGTGTADQKLAEFDLEFEGHKLSFELDGYRNSNQISLHIEGDTSFAVIKEFHVKMASEHDDTKRDGHFEISVNDFKFHIHNHFERRPNGYYLKSKMESTLTPLPALILGFGREGEETIVTIGYGDEKEITFSLNSRDHFETGFYGYINIPTFGYEGLNYVVEYGFHNPNQMYIKFETMIPANGKVEAHLTYDSEGVQARMNSRWTGEHSLRVRRSVSSEEFYAEAGVDDYNLKLRGGFNNDDTKKGFLVEGEIFGRKFAIDALFQSEGLKYTEGKLIIQTPFEGWQNIGGLFTWANVNKKIISHAEILLPSYMIPKITAEINLDFQKKIDGFITVDLAGEEFTFKSNLNGDLIKGYKGYIELITPFHYLSFVTITGHFKLDSASMETDLKIAAPFATHNIQAKYNVNPSKLQANVHLESSYLNDIYNIGFILENPALKSIKLNLNVNNNKITLEGKLTEATFLMDIDTLILGITRKFSAETKFESLNKLEGTLIAIIEGETHTLHGDLNIETNHFKGAFDIDSSLIEGTKSISFDVLIADASYNKVSSDLTFVGSQSHSVHFEFEKVSGIQVVFELDTPLFPKTKSEINLSLSSICLNIETPQSIHNLTASWQLRSEVSGHIKLSSPLLPVEYILDISVGGNQEKRTFKAELNIGQEKHLAEGYLSMLAKGGVLSLNLETPIKNINKASLEASLNFDNKFEMHLTGIMNNKINTLDLTFDHIKRAFIVAVESPFIPTGMVKAEAQLTGKMNKNMTVKMNLMNNKKAISGIFNVNIISPQNIKTSLKVTTPFRGYKKMNFVAEYKKEDDISVVILIEKPIKFSALLNLGNTSQKIDADLKIETSLKDLTSFEGHILIPKKPNEYRASVSSFVDGEKTGPMNFGAYGGIRNKAPYELEFGLETPGAGNLYYFIRTDSSVLSLLA